MDKKFTPAELREFAEKGGTVYAYLYQCVSGRRDMGPVKAIEVEKATNYRIRRWDLCPNKWHKFWPHLIGKKGAPSPKQPEAA